MRGIKSFIGVAIVILTPGFLGGQTKKSNDEGLNLVTAVIQSLETSNANFGELSDKFDKLESNSRLFVAAAQGISIGLMREKKFSAAWRALTRADNVVLTLDDESQISHERLRLWMYYEAEKKELVELNLLKLTEKLEKHKLQSQCQKDTGEFLGNLMAIEDARDERAFCSQTLRRRLQEGINSGVNKELSRSFDLARQESTDQILWLQKFYKRCEGLSKDKQSNEIADAAAMAKQSRGDYLRCLDELDKSKNQLKQLEENLDRLQAQLKSFDPKYSAKRFGVRAPIRPRKPDKPKEPTRPSRNYLESKERYDQRMKEYDRKQQSNRLEWRDYERDLREYEKDMASYHKALEYYERQIGDLKVIFSAKKLELGPQIEETNQLILEARTNRQQVFEQLGKLKTESRFSAQRHTMLLGLAAHFDSPIKDQREWIRPSTIPILNYDAETVRLRAMMMR